MQGRPSSRATCSQKLHTLLPRKASHVMARLLKEEAVDSEKMKLTLLRQHTLSAEEFRQFFCEFDRAKAATPILGVRL